MKKRILNFVLIIIIALWSLPTLTVADTATSGECGPYATWDYSAATKTLTIDGSGRMWNNIPWSAFSDDITTVVIEPNSVTHVGALKGLDKLTSIVIPEGVEEINKEAFKDCTNLKTVSLPSTLKTCKDDAFENCTAIERVNLSSPDAWANYSFGENANPATGACLYFNDSLVTSITIPEGKTFVNSSLFNGVKGITSVKLPSTLKTICSYAFANSYIKELEIPNGVEAIQAHAFDGAAITSIAIPDSVTDIGDYAFYNCKALNYVKLPSSIITIPGYAFSGCGALKKIALPEDIWRISNYAFSDSGLTVVYVASVDEIWEGAFYNTPLKYVYYSSFGIYENPPTVKSKNEPFNNAEWVGGKTGLPKCVYDNDTDYECNICGAKRCIVHNYESGHDDAAHYSVCSVCGDIKDSASHYFENVCDTSCDCGYVRTVSHDYKPTFDKTKHFDKCSVCNKVINEQPHFFADPCITDCDCGYVRTAPHDYKATYDELNHFRKCNVCGDTVDEQTHVFDNVCDTSCDCGYVRTAPHDYKPTFDKTKHFDKCSVCNKVINEHPHFFADPCTTDCDCGYKKAFAEHEYDNACDTICNGCGSTRTITHSFGNYVSDNNATTEKDGTKTRVCNVCRHKETVTDIGSKLAAVIPDPQLKDTSKIFKDVPEGKWFKQYVDYSYTHKIFNGTNANTFSPDNKITRAQFVQVLANLNGVDTSNRNAKTAFSDVPSGKWYTAAVKWASENNIVNGMGEGRFEPEANVTREQMCVMLVNFAKFKKITLNSIEAKASFADDGNISGWAKAAVYSCQQADIVNGKGKNKFDPSGTGSRAEASVIFTKFHKDYL